MADITAKSKFDAAVKVIRGLPKNGTFQPSHELMLKFYGFYKQSTEGPCTQTKPGFWDVVNKAKWEAWNKLKDMPKEEAMISYVDELKTIIEAMPQTNEVGHFLDKIGFFYEMVDEKEGQSSPVKKLGNGEIQHDTDSQDSEGEEQEIESESNISWNQDADLDQNFNHSAAVEEIMRKSEFINSNQKHITVSEHQTTHSKVSFDEQHRKINGKREEMQVNGGMNGAEDSGSESEEFCDTSDEPIQDPTFNGDISMQLNTSTPISKTGNHVRFSDVVDTPVLRSNPSSRNSQHRDLRLGLLSNSVPFAAKTKEAMLSDSLVVNTASNDSLNLSTDSQLGVSLHHPDNSIFNQSECESVMSRGGGNVQKGQGSLPVSSNSFNDSVGSRGNSGNVSGSRRGLFNTNSGGSGEDGDDVLRGRSYSDLNEQIAVALVRLQQDMNGVLSRLTNLEAMTERQNQERERKELQKKSEWWPFGNLSKRSAAFIFVWPFVAHVIIGLVCRRKRRR